MKRSPAGSSLNLTYGMSGIPDDGILIGETFVVTLLIEPCIRSFLDCPSTTDSVQERQTCPIKHFQKKYREKPELIRSWFEPLICSEFSSSHYGWSETTVFDSININGNVKPDQPDYNKHQAYNSAKCSLHCWPVIFFSQTCFHFILSYHLMFTLFLGADAQTTLMIDPPFTGSEGRFTLHMMVKLFISEPLALLCEFDNQATTGLTILYGPQPSQLTIVYRSGMVSGTDLEVRIRGIVGHVSGRALCSQLSEPEWVRVPIMAGPQL